MNGGTDTDDDGTRDGIVYVLSPPSESRTQDAKDVACEHEVAGTKGIAQSTDYGPKKSE